MLDLESIGDQEVLLETALVESFNASFNNKSLITAYETKHQTDQESAL